MYVNLLFPLGTFVVNAIGCFVFGILGGFTTFSSFAFERVALIGAGEVLWASINIAGQVVVGLAGVRLAWR